MKVINLFGGQEENRNDKNQFLHLLKSYLKDTELEEIYNEVEDLIHEAEDFSREVEEDFFLSFGNDKYVAGVILMISRKNQLHLNKKNRLNEESLSTHFKISKKVLRDACVEIAEELDISFFSRELQLHSDRYEYEEYEEANEVGLEFTLPKKISAKQRFDIEDQIHRSLRKLNMEVLEDDLLDITQLIFNEEDFDVFIEGPDARIEALLEDLETYNFQFKRKFSLEFKLNPYQPDQHYMDFMIHYSKMDWDKLENLEEDKIPEFLEIFNQDAVGSDEPTSIELAFGAYGFPKEISQDFLQELIANEPNNVEALICLAGWEDSREIRIDMLENAVEAGERDLDIENMPEDTPWWGYHKTRPYMRALQIMGLELLRSGYGKEGAEILYELIELNPHDNQGVRYELMEYLIIKKKWFEANKLFAKFSDDSHLTFAYGKFFYYYYTLGRKSKTKKELIKAYNRNNYPIHILRGEIEEPLFSGSYKHGDIHEASLVTVFISFMMERDEKLTKWMLQVLQESGTWNEDLEEPEDDFLPF